MNSLAASHHLECQARNLSQALCKHSSLYARTTLFEKAHERWERRVKLSDQVRRLSQLAKKAIPASFVLVPCKGCNAEGMIEAEEFGFYTSYDGRAYSRPKAIPCPECNAEGQIRVPLNTPSQATQQDIIQLRRAA